MKPAVQIHGVWRRIVEFVGSLGVGAVATVVDLIALVILVEVVGLSPEQANIPALLCGAVVQFIGCRHVVFRATDGSLRKQLLGFVLAEVATLSLNAIGFHLLVSADLVPYGLARPIATFVVFLGFSYPMWNLIFSRQNAPQES